ncbi:hypothetical protein C8J57DRAFT_1278207 [Mycena rebaudengoi]|nr:hypothetical protein C8J57DRAFT_1278207 [Mycena rebaudengoi]
MSFSRIALLSSLDLCYLHTSHAVLPSSMYQPNLLLAIPFSYYSILSPTLSQRASEHTTLPALTQLLLYLPYLWPYRTCSRRQQRAAYGHRIIGRGTAVV